MTPSHRPPTAAPGDSLAARIVAANNEAATSGPKAGYGLIRAGRARDGDIPIHRGAGTELSADGVLLLQAAGYEPVGVVAGIAVFHIGLVGAHLGSVELVPLSQALLVARERAIDRLRSQARRLGASGVIGLRVEIEAFDSRSHLARVVAVGSAIAPNGAADEGRRDSLFLSALSGQEFNLLASIGYAPVSVVMGVCVYHVARLGPRAVLRNLRTTAELGTYTGALYEARELAMRRLQEEAIGGGGEGVVGVTISEHSHVWDAKTIEFFCMGTSVRKFDGRERFAPEVGQGLPSPVTMLSLRDEVIPSDPGALRGGAHKSVPREKDRA